MALQKRVAGHDRILCQRPIELRAKFFCFFTPFRAAAPAPRFKVAVCPLRWRRARSSGAKRPTAPSDSALARSRRNVKGIGEGSAAQADPLHWAMPGARAASGGSRCGPYRRSRSGMWRSPWSCVGLSSAADDVVFSPRARMACRPRSANVITVAGLPDPDLGKCGDRLCPPTLATWCPAVRVQHACGPAHNRDQDPRRAAAHRLSCGSAQKRGDDLVLVHFAFAAVAMFSAVRQIFRQPRPPSESDARIRRSSGRTSLSGE